MEEYEGCQEMYEMELSLADEADDNVTREIIGDMNLSVTEMITEVSPDQMLKGEAMAEMKVNLESDSDNVMRGETDEINLSVSGMIGKVSVAEITDKQLRRHL